MHYSPPVYNLNAKIWRFGLPTGGPPSVITTCNLALGKRVGHLITKTGATAPSWGGMWLLCPPGTDIQDAKNGIGNDRVEVPAGTGRFYDAVWVDDAGSGFANEHRFAELLGVAPWPTPFPSPGTPPPPPAPGATCLTAATIALNTLYTYPIAAAANQWFTMPCLPSMHYSLFMQINSGAFGSANANEGNCAALVPDATNNVSGSTVGWTTGLAAANLFFQNIGDLMLPGNYSFMVTQP